MPKFKGVIKYAISGTFEAEVDAKNAKEAKKELNALLDNGTFDGEAKRMAGPDVVLETSVDRVTKIEEKK